MKSAVFVALFLFGFVNLNVAMEIARNDQVKGASILERNAIIPTNKLEHFENREESDSTWYRNWLDCLDDANICIR